MDFSKAVLPDHTSLKIKSLAYDGGDRILGVKGRKVSDYAFRLAASSGLIVFELDMVRLDLNKHQVRFISMGIAYSRIEVLILRVPHLWQKPSPKFFGPV